MARLILKLFFISSIPFFLLSSATISSQIITTEGIFLGYVEDEEMEESYYSFETEDEFLDFSLIDPQVLKEYNLKTSEFEGSLFSIDYSLSDENGEIKLESLELVEKRNTND